MRTSKSVCEFDAGNQRIRGRCQFFGKSAPSVGSSRQGPPLVVLAPVSPKRLATSGGTVGSIRGAAGKSLQGRLAVHIPLAPLSTEGPWPSPRTPPSTTPGLNAELGLDPDSLGPSSVESSAAVSLLVSPVPSGAAVWSGPTSGPESNNVAPAPPGAQPIAITAIATEPTTPPIRTNAVAGKLAMNGTPPWH